MRKRMAMRARKEILKHGATIIDEGWRQIEGDWYYNLEIVHCGWKISSPGDNMLMSYKGGLFAVKCAEEEPRE